jgi:endonuclease-3
MVAHKLLASSPRNDHQMSDPKPLKTLRTRRKKAKEVIAELRDEFPNTECSLIHDSAWQLLVATILSAQCTDARVNKVTPGLFAQFPTLEDFAEAPIIEIEEAIHSTGFYRNKSKSLQGAARTLLEKHDGEVPNDMKALVKVPGAGRKTANVVLGEIYNNPDGVVVDTHVSRISFKLGFSDVKDPVKAERQLNEVIPREDWADYGHLIIDHGRKTCTARSAKCDDCRLYRWCVVRA